MKSFSHTIAIMLLVSSVVSAGTISVDGFLSNSDDGSVLAGAVVRVLVDGVEKSSCTSQSDGFYSLSFEESATSVEVAPDSYGLSWELSSQNCPNPVSSGRTVVRYSEYSSQCFMFLI